MIREWLKRRFGLFDIEDLVVGANCGCCGVRMEREIVHDYWTWSVCQKCLEAPDG